MVRKALVSRPVDRPQKVRGWNSVSVLSVEYQMRLFQYFEHMDSEQSRERQVQSEVPAGTA